MEKQVIVKNAVSVFFVRKILTRKNTDQTKSQLMRRLGFYGVLPDQAHAAINLMRFSLSDDTKDGAVQMNLLRKAGVLYLQLIWPTHPCVRERLMRSNKLNANGLCEFCMEMQN